MVPVVSGWAVVATIPGVVVPGAAAGVVPDANMACNSETHTTSHKYI